MQEFQNIIGNDMVKKHLISAVEYNKVSHSYIIDGEDGMGKMQMAHAFSRLLLCEGTRKLDCDCRSCKQIISGNHPDIIYVSHEKPNTIGVDDVREQLIEDIQIKPYRSNHKIYILDEAEKLTVQAQNALLKTIEEPPGYGVIFLLTTNSAGFLQTILSRCVLLTMKPLSDEQIVEALKERTELPAERIETIAKFARGNLGKALKFAASEDFNRTVEQILNLMKYVRTMGLDEMLSAIRELKEEEFEVEECLDFIQMWYRDVLLFKATNDVNLLIFPNEFRTISEQASRSDFNGIETIIQAIDTARRRLNANVNYELAMELLLLTIKEN